MTLKQIKYISVIGVFLICFPFHFMYDWIPSIFTSIFFPVNESIWEHMKMISSSFLMWSLFEYLIIRKNNIKINNFLLGVFLNTTLSIIIFLIIYLPINYILGEKFIITLIILFISICLTQIINYNLLKIKKNYNLNIVSILLIIILYISYGYLTYNPILIDLFLDKTKNIYGINTFKF